jgi:signal transduction histidine kinase
LQERRIIEARDCKSWAPLVTLLKKIPILDAQGEIQYIFGIVQDITEENRLNEARLHTERERAGAQARERATHQFLTIVSHELKTPVTSLRMQLQMAHRKMMMAQKPLPIEKLVKTFAQAMNQVDRLTRLIEDVLDVSRIQSGKLSFRLELVDLSALLKDVLCRYKDSLEESNCKLTVDLEEDVRALADRGRVEQVIVNILSNAIKYAPGAPLTIELKKSASDARISIRDHGPGIDPREQTRIFERFGRASLSRNIGGLGLGLFISRQIVEAHGGTIQVESHVGDGSIFIITLPLKPTGPPMVDSVDYTAETKVARR